MKNYLDEKTFKVFGELYVRKAKASKKKSKVH